MENAAILGEIIKNKRLSLNLRMDDVAKKANITRATLSAIENGFGKCSITSLLNVMSVLDLSLNIQDNNRSNSHRNRATRINTAKDKKINSFVIMCVEQYAKSVNQSSGSIYKRMLSKSIISDLTDDYEDLHGMSTEYLNYYIGSLLKEAR